MARHSTIKIDTEDHEKLQEIKKLIEERTGYHTLATKMSFSWDGKVLEISSKLSKWITVLMPVFAILFTIYILSVDTSEMDFSRGILIAWGPMVSTMMFLLAYVCKVQVHRETEKIVRQIVG